MESIAVQYDKFLNDTDKESISIKKELMITYLENNDQIKQFLRSLIDEVDLKTTIDKKKNVEELSKRIQLVSQTSNDGIAEIRRSPSRGVTDKKDVSKTDISYGTLANLEVTNEYFFVFKYNIQIGRT